MTCCSCIANLAKKLVSNHPKLDWLRALVLADKAIERYEKRVYGADLEKKYPASEGWKDITIDGKSYKIRTNPKSNPYDYELNCTEQGDCTCIDVGEICVLDSNDCDCDCPAPKSNSYQSKNNCGNSAFQCSPHPLCLCYCTNPLCSGSCEYRCGIDYVWNAETEECEPIVITSCNNPLQKIIINDVDVTSKSIISNPILRENAISSAYLVANDKEGEMYLSKVNLGDLVKIYYRFEDGNDPWHQVFEGEVAELNPELSVKGELVAIKAYGVGIPLKRMRVRGYYGTDSENSVRDTVRSIMVTPDLGGVIHGYINRVLGTATASGYAIDGTYVDNNLTEFNYLYWTFVPITAALKDMCNLISAANYVSEEESDVGVHWQVIAVDGVYYLCLATIGDHENCTPADLLPMTLPDIYPSNYHGGTITITEDTIESKFQQLEDEANYVAVFGRYEFPTDELLTEGNAALWIELQNMQSISDENVAARVKIGSESLLGVSDAGLFGIMYYPAIAYPLDIDINVIGTEDNIPRISFYAMGSYLQQAELFIYTGSPVDGNYFSISFGNLIIESLKYYYVEITLGEWEANEKWEHTGVPDWTQIDHIGFGMRHASSEAYLWIDDLRINGVCIRAAYNSVKMAAGTKIKFITDSLAINDSLDEDNDSSMMAQMAKAELIRCQSTPITGYIKMVLDPRVMAGQLVNVCNPNNALFGADGTLQMRILEVQHYYGDEAVTILTLTDDLKNSYPRLPVNPYIGMLKATNPDHQDRQRGQIKSGAVDIGLPILEIDYA